MQRITWFFREWYDVPGGMTLGIPFLLTIALMLVGCVGDIALKLIF